MEHAPTVITGVGMVSALGLGRRENWEGLCAGRSGVAELDGFDVSSLPVRIGSQVADAPLEAYLRASFPRSVLKRTARFSQLCLAASRLAFEDAGLDLTAENRERIGLVVGNQGYGLRLLDEQMAKAAAENPGKPAAGCWLRDFDPMAVVKMMGNGCVAQVSIVHGLEGPSFAIGMGCASGAAAVCLGDELLRLGRADAVLAGGADALVSPFGLAGFAKLGALSTRNEDPKHASRPFALGRDGFVLGEGAAMLLLETAEHARRRGADVYATLLGHATTSEAYRLDRSAEDGRGMAKTMTRALAAARVTSDSVDYVSAHAASTPLGDRAEARAIQRVFGQAPRPWVSAPKSMLGHTMGAAGAIAIGVTALSVKEGVVTPTINYGQADPECDLDVVPTTARERRLRVAAVNAFGFGGHNCTVVLGAEGGR